VVNKNLFTYSVGSNDVVIADLTDPFSSFYAIRCSGLIDQVLWVDGYPRDCILTVNSSSNVSVIDLDNLRNNGFVTTDEFVKDISCTDYSPLVAVSTDDASCSFFSLPSSYCSKTRDLENSKIAKFEQCWSEEGYYLKQVDWEVEKSTPKKFAENRLVLNKVEIIPSPSACSYVAMASNSSIVYILPLHPLPTFKKQIF